MSESGTANTLQFLYGRLLTLHIILESDFKNSLRIFAFNHLITEDITLFKSLGIAVEDIAVAAHVYALRGVQLPDVPRDLTPADLQAAERSPS